MKNIFFIYFMVSGMFVQAVQQSLTFAQPNPIQYKVFSMFNKRYKDVVCVRTQRNPIQGGILTGMFLSGDVIDGIKKIKDLSDTQKKTLCREFENKIDKVSPGFYTIADFVPVDLLKKVRLSTIPRFFVVVSQINDLSGMYCDPTDALLMSGIGVDNVLKHMAAVERMPIKPKKVFFEQAWRIYLAFGDEEYLNKSSEEMRQTIKTIDAAKQTHFYAGLYLDKKIREDGHWRRFPKELRDNILGFVGYPYDALDKK